MKHFCALAALVTGIALISIPVLAADPAKPETIKDVMKIAHKGETSMVKRVTEGQGTDKEIKELVSYYKFMAQQEPPRGSKEAWNQKMTKLVKASEDLSRKAPGSLEEFKAAVNCKACHKEHKPEEKK